MDTHDITYWILAAQVWIATYVYDIPTDTRIHLSIQNICVREDLL